MVGFSNNIVFDKSGKASSYQRNYNNEYSKILNVFLPGNYSNKDKSYKAELSVAINNTFPREIVYIEGEQSLTDLNKYIFDLSEIYACYYDAQKKKPGLCKFVLYENNKGIIFQTETFNIESSINNTSNIRAEVPTNRYPSWSTSGVDSTSSIAIAKLNDKINNVQNEVNELKDLTIYPDDDVLWDGSNK